MKMNYSKSKISESRSVSYPECDWVGQDNACQEKLGDLKAFQPKYTLHSTCQLILCSPIESKWRKKLWVFIWNLTFRNGYWIEWRLLPTLEFNMISGALYHRVATYSVRNPVWSWSGSAILANPKSQIWKKNSVTYYNVTRSESAAGHYKITLRSQVVLRRRLEGLRSRWRTLAEWMYLRPRRIW